MAGNKIRLVIDAESHLAGIDQANEALKKLELNGKTLNQALNAKSPNLEAIREVMMRNYHSTSLFKGQLEGAKQLMADMSKVGSFMAKKGFSQGEIGNFLGEFRSVRDDAMAMKQVIDSVAKTKDVFDVDSFFGDVEGKGKAIGMFGTELEAVSAKMQMVRQKGIELSESGGKTEDIQRLADEYKKLGEVHDQLSPKIDGTGTRIKNLIKNFVSAQLIVFAIRKVFQLFTQGLTEASKAAAEAEQVTNKFLTVLGDMPQALQSVNDLVRDYGLGMTSAKNMLATIGDMAAGLGASDMEAAAFSDTTAKFIQDLVAFKDIGGDVIEITQAFMSGAAGNTRNFRQWGSVVREATVEARLHAKGLDELTGEALEWAKVQERVAIVMEQQANAVGATEREWDNFLSIQRRNAEMSKSVKEIVGREWNEAVKPLAEWWLKVKENIVAADTARQNYANGKYDPVPEAEFIDTPTARVMDSAMAQASIAASQAASKNLTNLITNPDSYKRMSLSSAKDWAQKYGATLEYTAKLAQSHGFKVEQAVWDEVEAYDALVAKQQAIAKAYRDSAAAATDLSNRRKALNEDIVGNFLGMDVGAYTARLPREFSKYSKESLVGANTKEADLRAKSDKLFELYQLFNNKLLTETDVLLKFGLQQIVDTLKQEIDAVNDEVQLEAFTKQNESLAKQVATFEKRQDLQMKYGQSQSDLVDIYLQQWEAEQEALELKNKAIEAGLDANKAEEERLRLVKQIGEYYSRVAYNATKANDMYKQWHDMALGAAPTVEQARQQNYAMRLQMGFAGGSAQDIAREQKVYAVNTMGPELEQFAMSLLTDAQKASLGTMTAVQRISALKSSEQYRKFDEYRIELLTKAELDYQKALKDARDESLRNIASLWAGIGDIGTIQGYMDTYRNVNAVDGAGAAGWATFEQVLIDIASRFDSFQDLFSVVDKLVDMLNPMVSTILEPMIMLIEPILSMVADLLVPVMVILFPIIKGVTLALLPLIAAVKTVTNFISWMGDTVYTFIWNLTHWANPREYRNIIDETAEIWTDMASQMDEVWNLELETRVDYVQKLTEAQKGELEAYDEMFKSGLLTLSQYQAMVGKNIYGKNYNDVNVESFATGGSFVTTGARLIRVGENGMEHVDITPFHGSRRSRSGSASYTVIVNGSNASPQEVARVVRMEFDKMERRGGYGYAY